MEGIVYIEHSSALPGASLTVHGDLLLKQNTPFNRFHGTTFFNDTVTDLSIIRSLHEFDIPTILEKYFAKEGETNSNFYQRAGMRYLTAQIPVTTHFDPQNRYWRRGRGEEFSLEIVINIPEQPILQVPGFFEAMKFAWMQYLSIMIVVGFICYQIKRFLIVGGLLNTREQISNTPNLTIEHGHGKAKVL